MQKTEPDERPNEHLDLRMRLRAATQSAHAALDAEIGPMTSLDGYEIYLRGLHAFRASFETALQEISAGKYFAPWRPSLLAPLLRIDLEDLELEPLACRAAPEPSSISAALGALYVLEGSTLGARILVKRVAALGMHGSYGARHLHAQAEDFETWRGFLNLLTRADDIDPDAAIAAANTAFTAAHEAMVCARHG